MSRKTSSAWSNISQATPSTVIPRPVSLPIFATKASNSFPCSSSHLPIIDIGLLSSLVCFRLLCNQALVLISKKCDHLVTLHYVIFFLLPLSLSMPFQQP